MRIAQRREHSLVSSRGFGNLREGEKPLAALALIVLLGLALRLFRLGADSIWYDEGVSLYLASLSIPRLVAHTAGDIHPPFYYLLLHFWLAVVGNSQFAAAFFSLFFGLLLIPGTFLVARRLLGDSVALLAALLVALSPYNLWYSQEMRMYTLGALLGLLSFYFMWRATTDSVHSSRLWLGYILCAALGLYTLYYVAFLLLSVNLAVVAMWLWQRRRSGVSLNLKAWIVAQIAVVVLYLPWLPIALRQAIRPPVPPWRSFTDLGSVLSEAWAALSLGQSVSVGSAAPVLLLTAIVYVLALLWRDEGRPAAWILLVYTFLPLLTIHVISLWTPLYHVRYVFLYAPAFYIMLARGLMLLQRASRALGVLVLIIVAFFGLRSVQSYFYDPAYAPDDHRAAVGYLAQRIRPGDAVLINAGYAYPTFLYYYDGEVAWRGRLVDYARLNGLPQNGVVVLQTGSIGGSPTLGWGSSTSDFYATTVEETAAALDEVANRHGRLWVLRIYDTVTDPQGFIRRYLNERFLPIEDAGFGGASSMRVQGYRTQRAPQTAAPLPRQTVQANFGNQVHLIGYDLHGQLASGQTTYLTTWWQAVGSPPDLRAFVSLGDESGQEWAHWDDVPAGSLYPTSRWAVNEVITQTWRLDVPVGTPPGGYRLEAGLYEAASGRRLDVYDSAGRPTGTAARLGDVPVAAATAPVNSRQLPMQQRSGLGLGGEVRLLGYGLSARLARPGDTIDVSVFWEGLPGASSDERIVFVQLQDRHGKVWAAWEGPPVVPWRKGAILHAYYRLLVPADAPDGEMRLIIGIYRAADRQRLPVEHGLAGLLSPRRDYIDMGMVRVAGREHAFAVPVMQQQVAARFADNAILIGYDLPKGNDQPLKPGESFPVTLYWQGDEPMGTSYTVFVQLLDAQNRLGGQHDGVPGGGLLPTTSWLKGEILTDPHQVAVRNDAPAGTYRLVAGLYDPATGNRLPVMMNGVRQPGDMVVLGEVTVQ